MSMERHKMAVERLRSSGYAVGGSIKGGDEAQDRAMIKSAIRQHETAEHGGKHSPVKLARGGRVPKIGAVNIVIANGGRHKDSAREPMLEPQDRLGPPPPPPMGAMPKPMPPMGGPPMGGPPGMPPPMADGGVVKVRGYMRRAAGGRIA